MKLGDSDVKVPTHLPLVRSLPGNLSPSKLCNTEVLGDGRQTELLTALIVWEGLVASSVELAPLQEVCVLRGG